MEPSCYSRLPGLNNAVQWELKDEFRRTFYMNEELTRAGGTASPYFFLLSTSCAPGTAEYEERRASGLLGHVKILESSGIFDYTCRKAYPTFDAWYAERGALLLRRPAEALPPLFMELVFGIHRHYLTYREIESVCCEIASMTVEDWRSECRAQNAAEAIADAIAEAVAAAGAGADADADAIVGWPEEASPLCSAMNESEEEDEEDAEEEEEEENEEGDETDDAEDAEEDAEEDEEDEDAEEDETDDAEDAEDAAMRIFTLETTRQELTNYRRTLLRVRSEMSQLLTRPSIFTRASWDILSRCHTKLTESEEFHVEAFKTAFLAVHTELRGAVLAAALQDALDATWSAI